jgi:hypothetical protein
LAGTEPQAENAAFSNGSEPELLLKSSLKTRFTPNNSEPQKLNPKAAKAAEIQLKEALNWVLSHTWNIKIYSHYE